MKENKRLKNYMDLARELKIMEYGGGHTHHCWNYRKIPWEPRKEIVWNRDERRNRNYLDTNTTKIR